jgi:prephenate dehydrogenase
VTELASFPLGRVAVVGAGQVGTMLGAALRGAPSGAGIEEVALFDRDPTVLGASLSRGAGDRALRGVEEALGSDVLVLALPVPGIVRFLEERGGEVAAGTLLIDTGSAKTVVVETMRRSVPPGVGAVGGHPMAGTERPGPEGADPELLRGAAFVLCPAREDPEALRRARAVATAAGARPVETDPHLHDRVVARSSHLPHLMASALALVMATVTEDARRDLLGPGYDGAVRLAASRPEMVAGFLGANGPEVRSAVGELTAALEELLSALDAGPDRLTGVLERARSASERLGVGP